LPNVAPFSAEIASQKEFLKMTSFRKFSIVLLVVAALASLVAAPAQAQVSPNCNSTGFPSQMTLGGSYTLTCAAVGGTAPYHYSYTGTLPPGMSTIDLTSQFNVYGSPNTAGTYSFTISVTDNGNNSGSQSFSVTVGSGGGGTASGSITISSVSPTTLTSGVAYSLFVYGTNFTGNSVVHFNNSTVGTSFQNSTTLIASLPAFLVTTGSLPVYVTDPTNGTTVTLFVSASGSGSGGGSLALSSISPTSAAVGSAAITLNLYGSGFSSGAAVNFGTICTLGTTFVSAGQLTATIPASCLTTAQTVQVSVGASNALPFVIGGTGSGGSGIISLSSVSPNTLTAGNTTLLYAYGSNFTSNSIIHFNNVTFATTYLNSSQIYATIPGSSITGGSLPVFVSDPTNGTSTTTYVSVSGSGSSGIITLSSVSPTVIAAGTQTQLSVFGANFTQQSIVYFNNSSVQTSYQSPTYLVATIPASLVTSGTLPVYVRDATTGTSITQYVTVSGGSTGGGLSLSSLSPTSVAAGSPAFLLTLYGSGFTSGILVNFGPYTLSGTLVNSNQFQVTVPSQYLTTSQTFNVSIGSSNSIPFVIGAGSTGSLSVTCSPATGPTAVGTFYSQTCSVTGGTSPYTWSVSGLPAGLSQSAYTGGPSVTISGTPTSSQSYAYTVSVTDSSASRLTGQLTITGTIGSGSSGYNITSLQPTSISVGSGATTLNVFGTGFTNASIVYFNGNALTTTYVSSAQLYGTIPANFLTSAQTASITVNTSGVISNSLTLAIGSGGGSGGTLSVTCAPGVGPQTIAIAYSATCTGSGGVQPYTWTVPGLPGYLTLSSSTGSSVTISGTPSSSGPYNYTVRLADSSSPAQTGSLQIAGQVTSSNGSTSSIILTSLSPSSAPVNSGSLTMTVNGSGFSQGSQIVFDGFPVVTTFYNANQLSAIIPAGYLTFARAAQVTVTTPGVGTSNALSFIIGTGVANPISISCSPGVGPATPNSYYAATCGVNGGSGPYNWTISAGSLPSGLTISPNGVTAAISGYTTLNGPYSYTIQVTDSSSPANVATTVFAGTTGAGSGTGNGLSLSSLTPNSAAVGSAAVTVTLNGTGYTTASTAYFNTTALATTFVNSGQLTAVIPANLLTSALSASITVSSSGLTSNAVTFTVGTVASTGITISCTPTAGPPSPGYNYNTTCTATGGKSPYAWSIVNSQLPPGLVLSYSTSSTVSITGVTFLTGPYNWTLQVTDSSTPVQMATYGFAGTLGASGGSGFAGTITSLNPVSAPVGGNQFQLTVTGTGYQSGLSSVYWNGTPLSTSYISTTQLYAIVPASLLTTIGTALISVQTSGFGATNQVGFFVSGASAVTVTPASLSFTYALGGNFPTAQTLSVSSSVAIGGFNVSVSGSANGINWLTASPTSSSIPGTVSVNVVPTGLAIGTYNGSVTITGYSVGSNVVIPVTLTVLAQPTFVASPATLTFTTSAGSAAATQTVNVTASDGNTLLSYSVAATANNGGNWLTVNPTTGNTPGSFTVTANASSLPAATYSGSITVNPTGSLGRVISIPVTFTVTGPTTLSASPSSLTFNAVSGQSNPAAQTVAVSSTGASTAITYTVAVSTVSGGSWLSATASNGTTPGNISVTTNISGLAAGSYSGSVTITGSGASNSPLTVPVQLVVTSAASLTSSPQSLTFNYQIGNGGPASQSLNIAGPNNTGSFNFTITAATTTGGAWLSASPTSGTTPGTVNVTANASNLQAATYNGTLTISSPGAGSLTVPVSLVVAAAGGPPSIIAAPQSLSFFVPGDGSTPVPQTVTVVSSGANTAFTASAVSQGGNWLTVNGGGQTPGSITVSVNPTGLIAGQTYNGAISVSAPGSNPNNLQVPVTLTLAPTGAVPLQAAPSVLYLTYTQGAGTDLQHVVVLNNGGGSVNFTVQGGPNGQPIGAPPSTCGNWLNIITPAGTATPSTPGVVAFTVNPSGVNSQTCAGSISINAASGQTVVPVYMAVSNGTQAILLSQTAMNFVATTNGSTPSPQTFQVLNPGSGSMPWNITATTLSGGSWLTVNPNSGTSQSLSQPGSPINVTANPQGLAAGTYYGTVQVAASGVPNSSQSITVSLTVQASAPAQVTPYGVILTSTNGNSSTQMVNITNPGSSALSYTAILSTDDGQAWLTASPTSGSIAAGGTNAVTLSATVTNLGTGLRHGTLRLVFSDGSVQTVDVQLAVSGASSGSGVRSCGSSDLALAFLAPQQNFQASAQVPIPLQVLVQDCNGNTLTSSNTGVDVLVGSSNADIRLNYTGNGVWAGTWTPGTTASATTLSARAIELVGASVASGLVIANGSTAAALPNAPPYISAVVNAGSFQFPGLIAPGTMVSIFGSGLADGTTQVNSVPFPNSLQGAQFSIRGIALPLFYASSGQVNAVMPLGLTADVRDQLIAVRDTTQSAPVDLLVADTAPGIFTINSQGTGQAAALVGGTSQIAAPVGSIPGAVTGPATAGQTISLFLAGMGTVTNPPADGSPSTGTSLTTATPIVSIGGVPATVSYSGLAPGEVGLYQLNVVIPAGTMTGNQVPVFVSIGNENANLVTIAIQ
jgi:uncharacterized protein (TIGR03437 family)